MSQSQTIPASEARNNFSDLISKVEYQQQEFLIERYGEIVAKLVPVKPVDKKQASTESSEEKIQTNPQASTVSQQPHQPQQVPTTDQNTQEETDKTKELKALESLRELSRLTAQHSQQQEQNSQEVSQKEERLEIIKKRIQLMKR